MSLQPLYRVDQARALDRRAIDELGIPGYTLMCRAGEAAARWLLQRHPLAQRVLIYAGPGNNGGDGYVMARALRRAGRQVQVLVWPGDSGASADARRARADWLAAGGQCLPLDASAGPADVVVDALFGIGLTRALEGSAAAAVAAINAAGCPVLALDVPSGLNADTGHPTGPVVQASATMTFIVDKCGLHTGAAADFCGEIVVAGLDLPAQLADGEPPAAERLDRDLLARALPPRRRTAHKGDFGHVLLIAGDDGYGGAARLAAEAAARGGAGLTSLLTRPANVQPVLSARPEIMVRAAAAPAETDKPARPDVLVIGPGLGQRPWGRQWLDWALQQDHPLVLDADALNLLAAEPRQLPSGSVITPHPGEAGRLLGCSTAEINADRYRAAAALAERWDCVAVLKGAGSLIAAAGHTKRVCPYGNPGMASGGSGDVLAGLIGALLAQGLPPFEAASVGVLAHALAGDAAAAEGQRGMLASDLLAQLRPTLNPSC
ncbi:MAG: NAD(P)H-hydrate dehydratase [Xanthomonadales bacterium]|nr:NAD(P)H-hydrate dehydratase [Xanthomonadales bacterium]